MRKASSYALRAVPASVTPRHVCIVHEGPRDVTLPFIAAHLERLPCATSLVHGVIPSLSGRPALSQRFVPRAARYLQRWASGAPWSTEFTRAYARAFRLVRPDVVLAEWGPVAVRCLDATLDERIPLVAHFHGYDASVRSVLEENQEGYARLFTKAAACVVVSRAMEATLLRLGAPRDRLFYNCYGIDCSAFVPGDVATSPPTLVAVGRFVEKKAPQLTLLAFAEARRAVPDARLRMIGDGPLHGCCVDLAHGLGVADAVEFLGARDTEFIRQELPRNRAFVLHSVTASNGDAEGTPNVVLEAGACGLPVIATRHGGIPDVVLEGTTGFLVAERDVPAMAGAMKRVLSDARLAAAMGARGTERVRTNHTIERSVAGLWEIVCRAHARARRSDN